VQQTTSDLTGSKIRADCQNLLPDSQKNCRVQEGGYGVQRDMPLRPLCSFTGVWYQRIGQVVSPDHSVPMPSRVASSV
jgi:hypothetical protein